MPAKKSLLQRSNPKQFRCTGYGDCSMVFTRSEHLARHERKHTGEKPYKCIVKTCGRMFSRFDNMMQHTQTHDKEVLTQVDDDPVTKSPHVPPLLDMVHSRTLPPLGISKADLYSRRSSVSSTLSSCSSSFHEDIRRRISIDALQTPIQQLGKIQFDENLGTVDISQDEFEVLEAFSQFSTSPVVKIPVVYH